MRKIKKLIFVVVKVIVLFISYVKCYETIENESQFLDEGGKLKCKEKIQEYSINLLINPFSISNNTDNSFNNPLKFCGIGFNDLGDYDKCTKLQTSNYYLLKLTIEKQGNNATGIIGLCLPIECDSKISRDIIIDYVKNFTFFISHKFNDEDVQIISPKEKNRQVLTPDWTNYLTIGVFSFYILISSGFLQFLFFKSFKEKGQEKENIQNNPPLLNSDIHNRLNTSDSKSTILSSSSSFNKLQINYNKSIYSTNTENENRDSLNNRNNNSTNSSFPYLNSLNSSLMTSLKSTCTISSDLIQDLENKSINNKIDTTPQEKNSNSFFMKIYLILENFNFSKNFNLLFYNKSNSGPNDSEESEKELKFINFIRVSLCFYIILLHSLIFVLDTPVRGVENFLVKAKGFWMQLIVNATFIVDAFFTLTGFFLAYIGLRKIPSKINKFSPFNSLTFFFHMVVYRILRIWPLLISCFFFFWKIFYLLGSGPVFGHIMSRELGSCKYQWPWISLLINNWTFGLYEKEAPLCFGWYWYIANDFQMTLIGFILIILYRKKFKLFLTVMTGVSVLFLSLEFRSIYYNHYGMNFLNQGTILSNFVDYYILLYNRSPPFFIGLIFGIFYYEYKVNKKFEIFDELKENKIFAILLYILGWVMMLSMIFLTYFSYDTNVNHYLAFAYNFLSRKIFSLGMILSILAIAKGNLFFFQIIRNLLSMKIFNFLARLSFSLYVIHPSLIKFFFYTSNYSKHLDLVLLFTFGCSFIVLTIIFSIVFHILFEMPFAGMKKLLQNISKVNSYYEKSDKKNYNNFE
jgi:peptidoglycan/LPS O-acetylase OafA/YrhL